MIEIREERPGDQEAIRLVNEAAFGQASEADIVDKLRVAREDFLSFVAIDQGTIVGHVLFTPVSIEKSGVKGMGLAPLAVLPERQRQGVGSLLTRHGLEQLRSAGCPFVVVLGHPDYYPRFGFEPASRFGLSCQWPGVPDEAFMVAVFDETALPPGGGVARYRDEFDEAI